jgi:hypothetical protein
MKVILHCSASEWGTARVIDKWHVDRGFSRIGYHFVILNGKVRDDHYEPYYDGIVEVGRITDEKGAHCKGHNGRIGICMIGESGEFTHKQYEALYRLLNNLRPVEEITQHSDHDNAKRFCAGIADKVMKYIKDQYEN